MVTRRDMLAAGAALAAAGWTGGARAQTPGLNAIAAARGMRFGSAFAAPWPQFQGGSYANPDYAALLTRDCGVLVPENELKWQATRPNSANFNFARFDPMLDWAEAHSMAIRGHTLLWHKVQRFPGWLMSYDFGANPVQSAEKLLTDHITTICGRYGTRIYSYDVVNETVDEKTGALRESPLSKAFGGTDAMLDHAYHTAREAAPHALLVYNDYMSWEPGNETFRAGVLKLLERFRKDKVPVDALGLQSHIGVHNADTVAASVKAQSGPWRDFLDAVTAMGYKLVVTEFDVNDNGLPADPAIRDQAVADYARAYFDLTLSYPQIRDVLAWGICDKYSWLNGFSPRPDGQVKRATPYDASFQPKPLYDALAKAFAAAPGR